MDMDDQNLDAPQQEQEESDYATVLARLSIERKEVQNSISRLLLQRRTEDRKSQLDTLENHMTDLNREITLVESFMEPIMPRCLPSRDQGSRTGPATTFKLPSNLPRFRGPGITDAHDFLEALSNTLLANSVEATRWTAALLVCCTEASDAAWI